jgi:hypothetical protein
VIAFGSSIQGAEAYRRYAEPGVVLASEPESVVYAFASVEPLARTYNLILDAAAERDDLEALVLVHSHTEITDPGFCLKVREALREPDVAVVGCAGAVGVRGIAWWEGKVVAGELVHGYEEFGGGQFPAYSWTQRESPPADVEAVDGQLLVLSPWAVRNLRFDEALILNYGFDVDFCLQARAAGRRVMVADLRAVFHRSVELVGDLDEAGWKRRARRAEADREAQRAIAFSTSLKLDARVLELERDLDEKTSSLSWRLTAPLRAVNRWRRGD